MSLQKASKALISLLFSNSIAVDSADEEEAEGGLGNLDFLAFCREDFLEREGLVFRTQTTLRSSLSYQ